MMDRRRFLQTSAAGLGLSAFGGFSIGRARAQDKLWFDSDTKRVGLIGTGWYGKCDLWRLVQVTPVEIVALCDVDKTLVSEAADIAATRQLSKSRPKTYGDYRQMLGDNDLDLVLIATPDHWHALTAIEAMEAGADLYLQKPISVDVVEGQAILDTARRLGRVVQVGTQRRSTPHLIEARDRVIKEGLLGKVAHVEICCYYHMRARGNPPDIAPPEYLDWEMYTGPAPMRPYNEIVHPRGWRAFMEYGNGIVGDMCIHMLDMVRWMLDLGWPSRISSQGGILVNKDSKANISDTQTATFDFGDLTVTWQHRTWGSPVDPDYPWAATIYGDKGTLKASIMSYDYIPLGDGEPIHGDVVYELEQYPEDQTEEDLERHVAPAIRRHMIDLLENIETRGKPVADIEQGFTSTACCVLANNALELGRTLEWDAEAGHVVGDDEANEKLARPYRDPWEHPTPRGA